MKTFFSLLLSLVAFSAVAQTYIGSTDQLKTTIDPLALRPGQAMVIVTNGLTLSFYPEVGTVASDSPVEFASTKRSGYVWRCNWDGDLRAFGVVGNGITDNTSAFNAAQNTSVDHIRIPAGRFAISNLLVLEGKKFSGMGKDTVLTYTTYPTYIMQESDTNSGLSLIEMQDNSILEDLTVDMQYGSITLPSPRSAYYGIFANCKTNVTLNRVQVLNGLDYPVFFLKTKRSKISDLNVGRAATGPMFELNEDLDIDRLSVPDLISTNAAFYQHTVDFFYNKRTRANGIRLDRSKTSDAAASYVLSPITIAGEIQGFYSKIHVSNPIMENDGAHALLVDGGMYSIIDGVVIEGCAGLGGIAIELAGSKGTIIQNVTVDSKDSSPGSTASGGIGILVIEQGVHGYTARDEYVWSEPGLQNRSRSTASGNTLSNIKIYGYRDGIWLAGSYNKFYDVTINGSKQYGIRIQERITSGQNLAGLQGSSHTPIGNIFDGFEIAYNQFAGVAVASGNDNIFRNGRIVNNNQSANIFGGIFGFYQFPITISTNSTTNAIVATPAFANNQFVDFWVYFASGPNAGQARMIVSNSLSLSTLYVDPPFPSTPAGGETARIVASPSASVALENVEISDNQNWTFTNKFSANPTQSWTSTTNELILSSSKKHLLEINQRLLLHDVLGVGSNLTVRVSRWHETDPDDFYVTPVSPTSGSFDLNTNVYRTMSGTVTYTNNPASNFYYDNFFLYGTGTEFGYELDGHQWFAVDGVWRRPQAYQSKTLLQLLRPFPAGFTNRPIKSYIFGVSAIPSQQWGIHASGTDFKAYVDNGVQMVGNVQGQLSTSLTPDFPNVRLSTNSTYPTLGYGNNFITANTSPTTITNFLGGFEGRRVLLVAGDTNTILDCTSSSIVRQEVGDYTLALGDTVSLLFSGTKWYATIAAAAGNGALNQAVLRTGDAMTGGLSITRTDASAALTLARSTTSGLTFSFPANKAHVYATNGNILFGDNGALGATKTLVLQSQSYSNVAANGPIMYYSQSTSNQNIGSIGFGSSLGSPLTTFSIGTGTNLTASGASTTNIVSGGPTAQMTFDLRYATNGAPGIFLLDTTNPSNVVMRPVSYGSNDSGGGGFRALRVPN